MGREAMRNGMEYNKRVPGLAGYEKQRNEILRPINKFDFMQSKLLLAYTHCGDWSITRMEFYLPAPDPFG